MNRLRQILLSVLILATLSGCASMNRPNLTPTDLATIAKAVDAAGVRVDTAGKIVADVYATGAQPKDKRLQALAEDLKLLRADLERAKKEIAAKQGEIDKLTGEMNKVVERLNYLEPKYAEAVGILWKWRLIAIGSWVAIAAFFIFRGWLKANVPFLGGIL